MNIKSKKFNVTIHYTGFCTYEVIADDEADAILKARNLPINQNEFSTTLENWEEADTAIKEEED